MLNWGFRRQEDFKPGANAPPAGAPGDAPTQQVIAVLGPSPRTGKEQFWRQELGQTLAAVEGGEQEELVPECQVDWETPRGLRSHFPLPIPSSILHPGAPNEQSAEEGLGRCQSALEGLGPAPRCSPDARLLSSCCPHPNFPSDPGTTGPRLPELSLPRPP